MRPMEPCAASAVPFASDDALVSAMIASDPEAWKVFVARHRSLIRSVIVRILRSTVRVTQSCDVDEVYSSLICSLFARDMHKLRAYDPQRGTRLSTWVAMLAMHAAQDHVRAAIRTRAKNIPVEHLVELADLGDDPFQALSRDRELLLVRDAVAALPRKDRQLLDLMYETDLSPAAIAARMHISPKTVYSKKHKIAARLRHARLRAEACSLRPASAPRKRACGARKPDGEDQALAS